VIAVHYARGVPFASLTALGPAGWGAVVAAADLWGRDRFADPEYLPRRAAVEAELRAAFVAAGGRPLTSHPVYAHLGPAPAWERQTRPGMVAYEVELAALPAGAVSFTHGDSLVGRDPRYRAAWAAAGRTVPSGALLPWAEVPAALAAGEPVEVQLWVVPPTDRVRARPIPAR
jgi:hypothetical protein